MNQTNNPPKNYFNFILISLKILGVSIKEIESPLWAGLYNVYAATVLVSCIYYYIFAEIVDLLEHYDDFGYVTFILCYLIGQIAGMLKGTLLLLKRKSIREYCRKLESGLFLPDTSRGGETESELIRSAIKFANFQAIFFFVFVVLIVGNRCIYAALTHETIEILDLATNRTYYRTLRILPYSIYLPFDTDRFYKSAFAFQVYSGTVFGLYIGACDALITAIMIHVKAQIKILKNSLGNYVKRGEEMEEESTKPKIPRKRHHLEKIDGQTQIRVTLIVKNIIKHHQEIIALAEETETQFSMVMLAQFLGSLFVICLPLVQLSMYEVNSPRFLSMACYWCLMLFQLLIYCWNGNELSVESLEIADAAYASDWTVCDLDTQNSMKAIVQRAQRPIRLSAGKFAFLSLETYSAIVRGSASYYLALSNMSD